MVYGIENSTIVSMADIDKLINVSNFSELAINVNNMIYGGFLFFTLFLTLWIILFLTANKVINQPLVNAMYSGAVVSIISLLARGIYIYQLGIWKGLISDALMWVFPIATIIIAVISWMTKE